MTTHHNLRVGNFGRLKRNWYRPGLENRYRETDVLVRVQRLPLIYLFAVTGNQGGLRNHCLKDV